MSKADTQLAAQATQTLSAQCRIEGLRTSFQNTILDSQSFRSMGADPQSGGESVRRDDLSFSWQHGGEQTYSQIAHACADCINIYFNQSAFLGALIAP